VIATYLLVAVISVSLLAICVSILGRRRTVMDQYVRCFLLFLTIHALHALVVRTYFADQMRLDYFAPYGLLYGPFLYYAYWLAGGNRLDVKRTLIHVFPFFIFLLGYLLWLAAPWIFSGYERLFGLSLYGLLALSLFSYTIWALFFRSTGSDASRINESRMLAMMAMVLAFVAVLFLVLAYSNMVSGPVRSQFNGSIVFLCMLGASLRLFFYIVRRTAGDMRATDKAGSLQVVERAPAENPVDHAPESGPYQKSAISSDQLKVYEISVRQMVEEKQIYLDDGLSLASLGQQLKIPKHHLSQVFSLRIGKNFNTYVNELRINHAIALMRTHPEWTITEIFLASGFTAKASFNRYFRQFHGTTPTEYRNGMDL